MKYIWLLLGMTFMGCAWQPKEANEEAVQVSVLRGPSAIAFAQWMQEKPRLEGKEIRVKILDSPEQIQAQLIQYKTDIAVLPMITAANLYNKGVHYTLLGCPIWGTLYLVGRDSISSPVYLFGAGTTPDILTRYYLQPQGHYTYNYTFATPREILSALSSAKVHTAVLSEPFLSVALHRDTTLQILADLNRPNGLNVPQTAILCRQEMLPLQAVLDSLLHRTCQYANEFPMQTIRILENRKVFGREMLTPESLRRCRIQYIPARENPEDIRRFLLLIRDFDSRALDSRLPDAHFIAQPL